jgi:hypothetical protein
MLRWERSYISFKFEQKIPFDYKMTCFEAIKKHYAQSINFLFLKVH